MNRSVRTNFVALALAAVAVAGTCTTVALGGGGDHLFATGVDGAGDPLPGASADPHYYILETAGPAIVCDTGTTLAWLQNSATSKWIWQQADGQPTHVVRTFRTTVDLTGVAASQLVIKGRWSTDNDGFDIVVNGLSTGNECHDFATWVNFTLTAADGVVAGPNTIDFVANDYGAVAGFRVEPIFGCGQQAGYALGDLNQDGIVDGADLGTLLGAWGQCSGLCTECSADLNCDCNVDGADLGMLLGSWTV